MPWRQATDVEERGRFVLEVAAGGLSMTELCERYGISRKTGYHWWARYRAEGVRGLEERSRRPHRSPRATPQHVVELVLEERRKRPHWGPKKLRNRLERKYPDLELPAESTIARHLNRGGLTEPRPRRRRNVANGTGFGPATEPNALWTTDFKGDFPLGNGTRCYPLTVLDSHTRFLLACEGLTSVRGTEAWPVFEMLFREMGLPERIGSDNGPPFGSNGLAGLSKLSVRFLRLGIRIERIAAGHPEQNGRHERIHRTLEDEKVILRRPPAADHSAQQAHFSGFRVCYNEERPHEALDGRFPVELYRVSGRTYREGEAPGLDYPAHYERRQIRSNGEMKWRGEMVFVSMALVDEPIGLVEVEDGLWAVYFGPVKLGQIRNGERHIQAYRHRPRSRKARSIETLG